MAKRYFYKCPLEAAFMAKHFGITLTLSDVAESPLDNWSVPLGLISTNPEHTGIRFLIHPDSEHVLEPQVGDVIKLYMSEGFEYGVVVADNHFRISDYDALHSLDEPIYKGDVIIIQRNGKAFMWPEVEGWASGEQ